VTVFYTELHGIALFQVARSGALARQRGHRRPADLGGRNPRRVAHHRDRRGTIARTRSIASAPAPMEHLQTPRPGAPLGGHRPARSSPPIQPLMLRSGRRVALDAGAARHEHAAMFCADLAAAPHCMLY
jgi:hypothetical protein